MTTPEQKIEKHLKKEVEASGGKVRKLKWIGKSGAPDRLMWWPGIAYPRAAFVELKAPGKKPTKVQEIEHAALLADGFQVFVVDSIAEANFAIKTVRGSKHAYATPKADLPGTLVDVKSPPDLPGHQDNSDLA